MEVENLLPRVAVGDPEATETLITHYRTTLISFMRRRGVGNEAEECAHDSLLALIEGIKEHRILEPKALASYLFRISTRMAVTYYRQTKQSRLTLVPDIEKVCSSTTEPAYFKEQDASIERMRLLLLKMNKSERELITRYFLDGQNVEEVCAAMNITAYRFQTIKSRAMTFLGFGNTERRPPGRAESTRFKVASVR